MWKNIRNAFLERAPFVILARKGISIVARMCWQKQTRYIFFVLNVEEHQKCFLKTRAVRDSCSKGNIDRSKNVLAETDKIHILRSKCGRTPEMLS